MRTPNNYKIADVCDTWDYNARRCTALTNVYKLPDKDGYFFVSDLQIDLDGSPRAYHPRDRRRPDNNTEALDWLTSVNVRDLHGIQGDDATGPRPGYYVSGTSIYDSRYPENDTRRWADSEVVPYCVLTLNRFPASSSHPPIELGDVGVVFDLRDGQLSPVIFADKGRAVGEGSLRLSKNLGFDPTVRPNTNYPPKVQRGQSRKDFFYLLFPDSTVGPPWREHDIAAGVAPLFREWGGVERIRELFPRRALWRRGHLDFKVLNRKLRGSRVV